MTSSLLVHRLALFIATGCGSGYAPKAPGTAGSLVGLVLVGLLKLVSPQTYLIGTLVTIVIGLWSAEVVRRRLGDDDPSIVVIDEVAGMLIAMAAVPFNWISALISFVLFRLFDVWKPWPIRACERLPGGLGIMADDLAAGAVTAFTIHFTAAWMAGI